MNSKMYKLGRSWEDTFLNENKNLRLDHKYLKSLYFKILKVMVQMGIGADY